MQERKIRPVTDGVDKEATYKTQIERYDKAVKNGFYFEAMLIVYAIMEDRLGRGFSISDVLIPDSQQDLTIKGVKTN